MRWKTHVRFWIDSQGSDPSTDRNRDRGRPFPKADSHERASGAQQASQSRDIEWLELVHFRSDTHI